MKNPNGSGHAALLAFSAFGKIGWRRLSLLERAFGSAAAAYEAGCRSWVRSGLPEQLSADFESWKRSWNLDGFLKSLETAGCQAVTVKDRLYPEILKEIYDPPIVLYCRGNQELLPRLAKSGGGLAVIGSRRADAYAEKACGFLLPPIVDSGLIIISGLAIGVDSLAHQEAVSKRQPTVGVLGSGLDRRSFYPKNNWGLAEKIVSENGLLISEFCPGTPPHPQNFPRRNRIVSGLARAVLIIEAGKRSGALITAKFALEQGREVLALPGNIFSENSDGPNRLLQAGAIPITGPEDILECFGVETGNDFKKGRPTAVLRLDAQEKIIYDSLKEAENRAETLTADEIAAETALDTATVNSTLSILELQGVVKKEGPGYRL